MSFDPDILITPCDLQPTALCYEAAAFVPNGTPCTAASVVVWRGTDGCSQHKKEIKKELREWHHYPAWDLIDGTHGATTSMNSNYSWLCPWKRKSLYFGDWRTFLLQDVVATTPIYIFFNSCLWIDTVLSAAALLKYSKSETYTAPYLYPCP